MSDSIDEGMGPGVFHPEDAGDSDEGPGILIGDPDKVVSARGTEDGLVLRIDGGADWAIILNNLELFLGGRKRFFDGGEVLIEWLERLPSREQCTELEELLGSHYGLKVATRRRKQDKERRGGVAGATKTDGPIPLFDEKNENTEAPAHQEELGLVEQIEQIASGEDIEGTLSMGHSGETMHAGSLDDMRRMLGEDLFYEDDANAKIVCGTLRSGQKVETPFSLIVIGDVNPGADLVAGGDIIVLGSLRGTAHASAYDDDAFESVIIALHMRPMQLRIGSIISRGSDDVVSGAEIARIENRRIVVEAFNPRAQYWRRG